jgi:hypothetical protein
MIDSIPPEVLGFVRPYLEKAAGKSLDAGGAALAEVGGRLWSRIKAKLGPPAAAEAARELEQNPGDADAQQLLQIHLKRALQQDEELLAFVLAVIEKARTARTTILQSATVSGNSNTMIQVGRDYKRG